MKLLRYLWALPNSLLGLLFVHLAVVSRGRMKIVDGVLEIHGGIISWILRRAGRINAITLGHVILGRDSESLSADRVHEREHVRQYEILGPAFLFVYLAASLWAFTRGTGAYRGNYLERKAVERERLRKI